MGPHGMGVGGGLIHPGEEGRAARCAGGVRGKDICVSHSLTGEAVQMGGVDMLASVAGEISGGEVLSDQPYDVRWFAVGAMSGGEAEGEGGKKSYHDSGGPGVGDSVIRRGGDRQVFHDLIFMSCIFENKFPFGGKFRKF
jgi:hypothetical protein